MGSDLKRIIVLCGKLNFNPRSPCGERLYTVCHVKFLQSISIHAPRVGSDKSHFGEMEHDRISIHAPRVGSDLQAGLLEYDRIYFNPRSPCGERHDVTMVFCPTKNFNPRSPCGERPGDGGGRNRCPENFNPRSPCGERQGKVLDKFAGMAFQSTLPVWGATAMTRE